MGFQTWDACRIAGDKSYIHKLEHSEVHQPVQRKVMILLAVEGPSSKKNRTNNDGRIKQLIDINVVAAAHEDRIADGYYDTVATKRITGVDINVADREDAGCLD